MTEFPQILDAHHLKNTVLKINYKRIMAGPPKNYIYNIERYNSTGNANFRAHLSFVVRARHILRRDPGLRSIIRNQQPHAAIVRNSQRGNG